jgi:hypothetical protein
MDVNDQNGTYLLHAIVGDNFLDFTILVESSNLVLFCALQISSCMHHDHYRRNTLISAIMASLSRKNWRVSSSSSCERQKQRLMMRVIIALVGVVLYQHFYYTSFEIDSISFYDSIIEDEKTISGTECRSTKSSSSSSVSSNMNEIQQDSATGRNISTMDENESNIHVVINVGCNPLQDCKCQNYCFARS